MITNPDHFVTGPFSVEPIPGESLNGFLDRAKSASKRPPLTKRELFAAMAMQGILANHEATSKADRVALWSVICADQLINQLNRSSAGAVESNENRKTEQGVLGGHEESDFPAGIV